LLDERFATKEGLTDAASLARAPHDDLGDAGETGELGDLEGDIVAVDRLHVGPELLGKRDVGREPGALALVHRLGARALHE